MYLYFSFLYFDRSSSSPDMASSGTEKSAPFDLTPQSEFSSQESLLIETRLLTQVCSQTTYKTADLSGCYSSWVEFSVWSKLIYIYHVQVKYVMEKIFLGSVNIFMS